MATQTATQTQSSTLHWYAESLDRCQTPSPNAYIYPVPISHDDSDLEVLIPRSSKPQFNKYVPTHRRFSSLENSSFNMYIAPTIALPPPTDDTIIPAIIIDVIPREGYQKPKKGIFGLLKSKKVERGENGILKVIYMPRKDYLKNFARGVGGQYIGTAPHRRWTEDELEEEFGKYKPVRPRKSIY